MSAFHPLQTLAHTRGCRFSRLARDIERVRLEENWEAVMSNQPAVGIGHLELSVGDLEVSSRFYSDLGLVAFQRGEGLAIFELRGGTHLLLFSKGAGPSVPPPDRVDLMISGRTRSDLEAYRSMLLTRGIEPSEIPDETLYGHHVLRLRDPDGIEVMVTTSHSALTEV